MISSTLLLVLGGCLLGLIQVLAGIGIGIWLCRDDTASVRRVRRDMMHAGRIATRLQALTNEVSTSVGEHSNHLDEANQMLTAEDERPHESLVELVVEVIDDIVRANQGLKSKLDNAESRLREQAVEIEAHISRSLTDPLTGLPNRREFNERLEARMGTWERRMETFALVLVDIDHFKRLNDQYGHLAGDRMLASIGRALRGALRREDSVARYGGEEFAILLPRTSIDQAVHVAQKVHQEISRVVIESLGRRISVTASSGIAMIQANEKSDSLLQRADAALYAAKAGGRNCAYVHDGNGCRAANGNSQRNEADMPASPPAPILPVNDRIGSPAPPAPPPEQDAISAELAQTCEELRRFVKSATRIRRAPR